MGQSGSPAPIAFRHVQTHFAELVGEEQGLEERVHVASRALVLQADVASLLLRVVAVQPTPKEASFVSLSCLSARKREEAWKHCHALVEVVPEHASLVLQNANERRDDRLVILNDRL